jgi:hypothetical protein
MYGILFVVFASAQVQPAVPLPLPQTYGGRPAGFLDNRMAAEWLRGYYGLPNAETYLGIPYGRRAVSLTTTQDGTIRPVAYGLTNAMPGQTIGESEYPAPTSAADGRPMSGSDWQRWQDRTFPRSYE